jgi:hypothetical protein
MAQAIDNDPINKVDSLAGSIQVDLSPVVFALRGVRVARRRSGRDSGVSGIKELVRRK